MVGLSGPSQCVNDGSSRHCADGLAATGRLSAAQRSQKADFHLRRQERSRRHSSRHGRLRALYWAHQGRDAVVHDSLEMTRSIASFHGRGGRRVASDQRYHGPNHNSCHPLIPCPVPHSALSHRCCL